MKPNCENVKNINVMADGTQVCCDSRKENCPYLRFINIENKDTPVCIWKREKDTLRL